MGNHEIGRDGEAAAAAFLVAQGYRVLNRNYRCARVGEIDLVAEEGDTLVFVEVKTRRSQRYGTGAEAVNRKKQTQLVRLAHWYMAAEGATDRSCRFDVVEVVPSPDGWQCRLIRQAFWAGAW